MYVFSALIQRAFCCFLHRCEMDPGALFKLRFARAQASVVGNAKMASGLAKVRAHQEHQFVP